MHASRRQKKARARPFSPTAVPSQPSHLQQTPQPAYKVAKLVRGQQGFGFTISGQAPCILSCVVPHSSADRAGLHAGDCLLAVNGRDVSRAPHDEVVRLVGSCMGTLRLHLAESGIPVAAGAAKGYSSSDEESDTRLRAPGSAQKSRPNRNRHQNRMKRKGATPPSRAERVVRDLQNGAMTAASMPHHSVSAGQLLQHHHQLSMSPSNGKMRRRRRHSSGSSQEHIAQLLASPSLHVRMSKSNGMAANGSIGGSSSGGSGGATGSGHLMYRSVVGYLGTIEMPEDSGGSSQSSPGSANGEDFNGPNAAARLAAIRSCVRRLRVEKKVHTLVLFRVWGPRPGTTGGGAAAAAGPRPSSSGKITLTSPSGSNLAKFPARRVVFCGAYADDARFFGLVTSASSSSGNGSDSEDSATDNSETAQNKMMNGARKNPGFTSCHVFMVDSRLVAHEGHAARAHAFRFQCTPANVAGAAVAAAAGGDERCLEFPPTAEPILQAVLSLCASSGCHGNNPIGSGLMGWANPLLQQQQQQQQQHNLSGHSSSSSSSSSNSDSGIFRDRDDVNCSDREPVVLLQRVQRHQPLPQHQQARQPSASNHLDRLTVRAMPARSPGEVEHAARLRSSMQRYLHKQGSQQAPPPPPPLQPQPSMVLLNRNTGTHQHVTASASAPAVNPSLSVRATMTLEEKLSPQVYKGTNRPILASNINRPVRTPSERNRARSLDDLSKGVGTPGRGEVHHSHRLQHENQQQQHHHHHHPLGSDNGLDRIDWEDSRRTLFTSHPEPQLWHSLASSHQSSRTMVADDDDQDDDDHQSSQDDVEVLPPIQQEPDQRQQPQQDGLDAVKNEVPPSTVPAVGETQQQHAWSQGFEKLLEDPLGLRTFAEFLKKEFSHENIYFWAACERFHRLFPNDDDDAAARLEAQKIFERHLGPAAPEPVNVDSQARQTTEDHLPQPGPELFDQAQKQVFNLMKYDCYPRFLRSAIYRQCVEALDNGQPPPVPESTLHDPDLNVDYDFVGGGDGDNDSLGRANALALKKSGSDAGERRRRSLLPWPKKDRSKSKDRGEFDYRKTGKKKNRLGSTGSANLPDKEKENGTDCDDDSHQSQMMKRAASKDSVTSEFSDRAFQIQSSSSTVPLVKVLLPDLSSAVIAARTGQSVQQLLNKLLERRGLKFNAFELYDNSGPVELERDASILAGLEVRLEPRAVFHVLLAGSGKSLMIRGQPRRQLGEVLKPILIKYGLKMEQSTIVKAATGEAVNAKMLLSTLDGLHLKVSNGDESDVGSSLTDEHIENNLPAVKSNSSGSLLGRAKGASNLARRNSLQATERNRTASGKKTNSQTSSAFHGTEATLSASSKRLSLHDLPKSSDNLMPPPRAPLGTRKPTSQRNPLSRLENEVLYEHLKRAQRCRLEDQRGTEINTELPDFLKLPADDEDDSLELPLDGRVSEPILGCRPRLVYRESYEVPIDGRASEPIFSRRAVASEPRSDGNAPALLSGRGSCTSPDFAAIAAQILDKSFSSDGMMPTHEQADRYFGAGSSSAASTPAKDKSARNGGSAVSSNNPSMPKITVAAAKQNVANVAARIAAIEQNDRQLKSNRQMSKSGSNSNWDDLLLDLDVDWRCYQGRSETDDQKQQLQQHHRPRPSSRPPLPILPAQQQQQQHHHHNHHHHHALEMLDLDDPLIATGSSSVLPAPPPPLPPKPGRTKVNEVFKVPLAPQQPVPPPRPPSRNVNTASRVNVSFV